MTLKDWCNTSRERISEYGTRGAVVAMEELWMGMLRRVGKQVNHGQKPFDEDWDVLVILDACRHDALQSVADSETYDWLPEHIPSVWSCASQSPEFVDKAFDETEFASEMENTALVTANSYPGLRLDGEPFGYHVDVSERKWDSEIGTVRPPDVSDYAIDLWRKVADEMDRLIIWYLQPHTPYRSDEVPSVSSPEPVFGDGSLQTGGEISYARDGVIDVGTVWDAYIDNINWALEDIARLRKNLDADQAILTADHGEAFGDFGVWGHPRYVPTPALRRVPWVEIDAEDTETSRPNVSLDGDTQSDTPVEDRLEALGYKSRSEK